MSPDTTSLLSRTVRSNGRVIAFIVTLLAIVVLPLAAYGNVAEAMQVDPVGQAAPDGARGGAAVPDSLAATSTTYTSRAAFEATLQPGSEITDHYGTAEGYVSNIYSNAAMNAVFGETQYRTTGWSEWNIVRPGKYYCAGCNGSFRLLFQNTSVSQPGVGVYGVGVDIGHNYSPYYHAFVTYGDGTTQDFALPGGSSFFGVTSPDLIASIHFGLSGGGGTKTGSFTLGSLTIGLALEPADLSVYIDSPQCSSHGLPSVADSTTDGLAQPPGVAVAGEELIYDVSVYNSGPGTAFGATATVTLPMGVAYLADTDSCTQAGSTPEVLTCDLGDIEQYDSYEFKIKTRVDPGAVRLDADGTIVATAQAHVESLNPDPNLENNLDDCDCFVQDLADLSVIKMSKPDDLVPAGETFMYTIYVDNTGPSWARGVYITDDMIASDEFEIVQIIDDPQRNDSCDTADATPPQTGQIIRCELREPLEPFGTPGGTGRWRLQVEVIADETQDIDNTVRVYTGPLTVEDVIEWTSGTPDPDASNNVAIDNISILDTADLELTKRDDLDPVTAGNLLRYTIRVTNTGHGPAFGGSTATNVRVYDNLPAETELIAVAVSDGDCNAGTPGDPLDPTLCIIDEFDVGESATMSVYVRVSPDVPVNPLLPADQPAPWGRARIFNDAWVESDVFDPDLSNNLDSEATDVKFAADLQVFKSDQPDILAAGELLSYEIIVNNAGPSTSRDVVVVDRLPDEVEFVSATLIDGGEELVCEAIVTNQLVCALGDIPPGTPPLGQKNLFVTVRVKPDTPAGVITNEAQAFTFATYDPNMGNNMPAEGCTACVEETTVVNAAAVTIEKTAVSSSVTPPGEDREGTVVAIGGGTLTYRIDVTNNGPSTAYNVTVTDPLNQDLEYVYSTSAVCTAGNPVTCDLGTLQPGETRTFEIIVAVHEGCSSGGAPTLTNTSTVTWDLASGESGGMAEDTETVPVECVADLRVRKFGKPDGEVRAGEPLTYTIIVDNLGPSFAPMVTITDELRSDGVFDILGLNPDATGVWDLNATCYIDAPTSEAPINPIGTNVPVGPPYVPGAGPIAPGVDQRATITCELNPQGTAEMPVFGPPYVGNNTGTGEGRWIVEVVVQANDGVDINNCADVSSLATDPDFGNNSTCTAHEITEVANLAVEKTARGEVGPTDCDGILVEQDDQVTPGGNLHYEMRVFNSGPSIAENVTLYDRLPPGIQVTGYSVKDEDGNRIGDCTTGTPGSPLDLLTCGLDTLATGTAGVAIVTVDAEVDPNVPDGTILENDVSVWSDMFDDDNSDNYASNLTRAVAVADLEILKSGPAEMLAGTNETFFIRVKNKGLSTARDVVVEDYVPLGLRIASARVLGINDTQCEVHDRYSGFPLPYQPANAMTCMLGDLPPGDAGEVRIAVDIYADADVEDGTDLINMAFVSSYTTDPCPTNDQAEWQTTVYTTADVWIEKDSEPEKVFAGEQKQYFITVGNDGPADAQDVRVLDVLPDEVEYEIDTNSPMCTQPAELIGWRANLGGANEVPPVTTSAQGLATFVLNTATNELTYSLLLNDIDKIQGAAGIHIHEGAAGENGAIVLTLYGGISDPEPSATEPWMRQVTLSPALAAAIAADPGGYYVNVQTLDFPDGEIRGQLVDTVNAPLSCEIGVLEPGEERHFEIWVRVRPETPPGTMITNVAMVVSETTLGDDDLTNNTAFSKNLVLAKSDLQIVKFGKPDGDVRAGNVLTYTVIVDNLGPSYAPGAAIKDLLQSSGVYDLIDVRSDRAATCESTVWADAIHLDAEPWPYADAPPAFGVLPPAGVSNIDQRFEMDCVLDESLEVLEADGFPNPGRWMLTMRVRAPQTQDINNVAMTLSEAFDPDYSNNEAFVEHDITDVADLGVTKEAVGEVQVVGQEGLVFDITDPGQAFPEGPNYGTDADQVTAGRRISYQLTVTNHGPSIAENTVLTDRLPPGVTIYPGSLRVSQGACETGTAGDPLDRLTCGLGNIAWGDSVTLEFEVLTDTSLPAGTVLENDVRVWSDIFDDTNANNHAHTQTAVNTWADMSIAKWAVGSNLVDCDTVLRRPVYADLENSVTAGHELLYGLHVQNNGASDAQNVQVVEILPPTDQVTFLEADGAECRPDDLTDNILVCELGAIPAGARKSFTIKVLVDSGVPDGWQLYNYAEVLYGPASPPAQPPALWPEVPNFPPTLPVTNDPYTDNNYAWNLTAVNAAADVWIDKVDVPAEVRLDEAFEPDKALAGEEHRYKITFGNDGPSVAWNIEVFDYLDYKQDGILGERFLRCEPFDIDDEVTCSPIPGDGSVIEVVSMYKGNHLIVPGHLNPGDEFSFYLITEVDAGYVLDADDFLAFNDSQILTSTADCHQENNVAGEDTLIIAEADLAIEKTDIFGDFLTCDPVEPGGMLTYNLTVTNEGPSDAADVYAVDWLPAEGIVLDPDTWEVFLSAGEVISVRDDGRIEVRVGNDPNNEGENELGRLNVGSSETVTIRVQVALTAECGAVLVDQAYVETRRNDEDWPPAPDFLPGIGGGPRTPTADPDLSNNVAIEGSTVECPAIEVEKTISFDGTCPGQPIPAVLNQTAQPVTFCYEVTNTGTTWLDDIYLEDVLTARTIGSRVIYTDTITFGADPLLPVAPGETVKRQVTIPHLLMDQHQECGKVTDTVTVTGNPVNSGRTDLPCLADVTDSDTKMIEVPCAGVDWRLQLPIMGGADCDTWIQVQNVGDAETMVMLLFWGDPGFCPPQSAGPLKAECSGLLAPGSAWSFTEAQVPSGANSAVAYSLSADPVSSNGGPLPFGRLVCDAVFYGVVGDDLAWAEFDSAYRNRLSWEGFDFGEHTGEPIAATVNRACPDPVDPNLTNHAAYIGVSSDMEGARDPRYGGYMYYAPLIFADQAGLNTVISIQNSGELCTSLEIWFKAQDNCLRSILGDVLTLAPGETITFDPNTVVGPGWIGTAWVRGSQPLGIVVDTHGANHFTSYSGVAADVWDLDWSYGNNVNFAPLIYSEYQGWDTAIQVQNLSAINSAKVKVYFLDRSGDVITTLVDWICPRGSQTFFLPLIDAIPGNWVGSARVESQEWVTPGGPLVDPPRIASVVMLEKFADPQRTTRREAVAYNAQTDCLLYEWQIGAGRGGTQSGSAVFAVPLVAKDYRGITTELAITNLVPKPGFTDFAIFIYDQNGLLDWVCEKLNEKQVEYIDLSTWGSINPRFMGSVVVSAVFWEHDVFDGTGQFTRNLVGLGGVAVERIGGTLGGDDVPGDESKAFEAFPVYDHFGTSETPRCPGVPGF